MKYIIEGNEKELERVLREQRIRVGRGLIVITPVTGCGLVTEEDALKLVEAKTEELNALLEEKDGLIVSLTGERDSLNVRITELEATLSNNDDGNMTENDNKILELTDSKTTDLADSKEVAEDDSMFVDIDADNPIGNTAAKKVTTKKK